MKRLVLVMCCCWWLSASLFACDACGSSTSNLGSGLLTDYKSNFLRLSYFNSRFNSSPEHEYVVRDQFEQFNFTLRYTWKKLPRVRLMMNVPFGINSRKSSEENSTVEGIGDMLLLPSYVLLNNIAVSKNAKLYLETGAGLNMPTGQFDSHIHERNLPENFNIGRGSWGYLAQLNAVLSKNKNGLVFNNAYQANSNTQKGYRFGNQYVGVLTAYRELKVKNFKLIPNIGLRYEATTRDEYANGRQVEETGGEGMFLTSAINYKSEKWLAGFNYTTPLSQEYANGEVDAKGRLACHLAFIF